MRIFVLEDMWDIRKDILTRDFPVDIEIILAANYDEAIAVLPQDNFDVYMFDHDLGFDDSLGQGSDVSRYMKEKGLGKNKPFIFHSTNPVGIDHMISDLNSDGRTLIRAPINILRRMNPAPTYWSIIQGHI